MPVDDNGRKGLVPGEDLVEGAADGRHLGPVERRLVVGRRVPGGEEEGVALAQGDVKVLSQVQDELTARPRSSRLDEAQMTGRDLGFGRQVELAEPPALPPVAEQVTHAPRRGDDAHRVDDNASTARRRLPLR